MPVHHNGFLRVCGDSPTGSIDKIIHPFFKKVFVLAVILITSLIATCVLEENCRNCKKNWYGILLFPFSIFKIYLQWWHFHEKMEWALRGNYLGYLKRASSWVMEDTSGKIMYIERIHVCWEQQRVFDIVQWDDLVAKQLCVAHW